MNINKFAVLRMLIRREQDRTLIISNQRELAEKLNWSLGLVNKVVTSLRYDGFLAEDLALTKKAKIFLENSRVIIKSCGLAKIA